jgi:predicted TIM-barrel enzyme
MKTTSDLQAIFGADRVLLPVIHVVNRDQAIHNVSTANQAGAHGAFLISHGQVQAFFLNKIIEAAANAVPGFWLGVNYLDLGAENSFGAVPSTCGGLWVDNPMLVEGNKKQSGGEFINIVRDARELNEILYFGGVAFKYQQPVKDLAGMVKTAIPYVDVLTTSGPGTGKAADVAKVSTMREAIGAEGLLGLASGVTVENAASFLPFVNTFLVATGINKPGTDDLDPDLTKALADIVRG